MPTTTTHGDDDDGDGDGDLILQIRFLTNSCHVGRPANPQHAIVWSRVPSARIYAADLEVGGINGMMLDPFCAKSTVKSIAVVGTYIFVPWSCHQPSGWTTHPKWTRLSWVGME